MNACWGSCYDAPLSDEATTDAEKHLVQAVKRHAKDAHDLDFGEEQVVAMMEIEP